MLNPNQDVFRVTGSEDVVAMVDPSFLVKEVQGAGGDWTRMSREYLLNGFDAGATKADIYFIRKPGGRLDVTFVDNGTGASAEARSALASVNVSLSRGDHSKRGLNGTGSKTFILHAERLLIETRLAGEAVMRRIEYGVQDLFKAWNTGRAKWDVGDPPAKHFVQAHGTAITLINVGHGDYVDPKHERTAQRLIDELGNDLLPEHAARVRVIDERGVKHTLKARTYPGKVLEGAATLEKAGAVGYSLTIVSDPDTAKGNLDIWAMERVLDISGFLGNIRSTRSLAPLISSLRNTLFLPNLVGRVIIPRFNEFSLGDRGGFSQTLYDDEELLYEVLRWLQTDLSPKISELTGSSIDDQTRSDTDAFRSDLVRTLQAVCDGGPKNERGSVGETDQSLRTSPAVVVLEPGMTELIEVVVPRSGVTYQWNDKLADGTLNAKEGTRVSFTAGQKLGSSFLVLTSNTGEEIRVQVKIVAVLPFGFSKSVYNAMPRQLIKLNLVHTHRTSGRFTWDDTDCGGVLKWTQDGLTASYTAPDTEGEFPVTVREVNPVGGRSPVTAKTYIMVSPQRNRLSTGATSDSSFTLEGEEYSIEIRQLSELTKASYTRPSAGGSTTIFLNFAHPLFNGKPDRVRRDTALQRIAMEIAVHRLAKRDAAGEDGLRSVTRADLLTMLAHQQAELVVKFMNRT